MDKEKLLRNLTDLGIQGGKKIAEMTAEAIETITPVLAEKSEKAVSFIANATDQNDSKKNYALKLNVFVDQFTRNLLVHVQSEGTYKYTLQLRNKLFSTQLVLYGKDNFEIGYIKMKENASRHGKAESRPVDFELFMGTERFSMIRSLKGDRAKRTYVYDKWKIERPVFGKDFTMYDENGNELAKFQQQANAGDYTVYIDDPKNEIRILFALAAMECEYVK